MLEAAIRIIDETGIDALTTNAIAERAGVSIGTLYQYFDGKEAILDALAKKEVAGTTARVKAAMASPSPARRGERIPMILQAVLASYGGRRGAHRRVMSHVMSRGRGGGMNPLFEHIVTVLSHDGLPGAGGEVSRLSPAEAFVITHAMAGVMRGVLAAEEKIPPREDIEAAITRLVLGFAKAP